MNKKEKVVEVRGNGTKTWLRDCDTWCSYWDKNCLIQVDLFIPVLSSDNPNEYKVLNSQMKVMTLNEKRLRKGWFLNPGTEFTEWLFLEGKHGDEWQYNFTGRHRKRGTTSEFTVQNGLSAKVSFKIGNVGVELSPSNSITNKISRANKDCELGNDIARYCRLSLPEKLSTGTMDVYVTELW
ncbi:MAG: hypothetical protein J5I59_05640 [Saprospiraceae bacterium]|nr:hypothetical protein [Saprospiraceae bacterium]